MQPSNREQRIAAIEAWVSSKMRPDRSARDIATDLFENGIRPLDSLVMNQMEMTRDIADREEPNVYVPPIGFPARITEVTCQRDAFLVGKRVTLEALLPTGADGLDKFDDKWWVSCRVFGMDIPGGIWTLLCRFESPERKAE